MTVPFVVLGGYLGAGKTTLINALLQGADVPRCGILVNDFGAINVDAELIDHRSGETVALTNGCACCRIQDDLGEALDRLLSRDEPFDVVLVEASGVAHPDKIAGFGRTWPGLRPGAVLVAVDATRFASQRRDKFIGRLVEHQVQVADRVLLTKTDLADTAQMDASLEAIGRLRSAEAPPWLTPLVAGEDPLLSLLTIEIDRSEPVRDSDAASQPGFVSRTVALPPVAPEHLRDAARRAAGRVERLKGFVRAGDGVTYLLQGTRSGAELTPWPSTRSSQVVLIARDVSELDEAESILLGVSGSRAAT